jgi:hypothetical protein
MSMCDAGYWDALLYHQIDRIGLSDEFYPGNHIKPAQMANRNNYSDRILDVAYPDYQECARLLCNL